MGNSTNDISEKLVQYLDGELSGSAKADLEKQLADDKSLQDELVNLKLARDAVRSFGLKQEVSGIHQQVMKELQSPLGEISPARRIIRYSLSIAAGLVIIFLGITTYNYYSLSPEKLFKEYFRSYELNIIRDPGKWVPTIDRAYKEEDYRMVTSLADTSVTIKNIFLSSVAYLELSDPSEAIQGFTRVLAINKSAGSVLFKDESEYYLALAFILDKKYDASLLLLEQIKNNPGHLYKEKVTNNLIKKVKRLR